MESIQASLEAEARGRNDAVRAKKKLEQDINDLEVYICYDNTLRIGIIVHARLFIFAYFSTMHDLI